MLVIGEGPARAVVRESAAGRHLHRPPERDDLARALASADMFLNPSITETFGNVTLEAMACALPVVAAAATGATNLVRDGETGRWPSRATSPPSPPPSPPTPPIPRLRARHGAAGLAFAKTQDWDVINAAVLKTYIRAIERRERLSRMQG